MDREGRLVQLMIAGDINKSLSLTERALAEGFPPTEISNDLTRALRKVGDAFEKLDIFLPELMNAADVMIEIMKIIEPRLQAEKASRKKRAGKILLATVKGDTHEIGKNIVKTLFLANRFEVVDLGADVPSLEIVNTAKRESVDLVGLSALMTTTMLGQREVIEILAAKGLRHKFRVIIGGCPTSQEWADRIGSDGWAPDAASAVRLAERLLKSI